jgi:diphthamide synthase (EF-2-diphthine--ammonia ligase)
MTGEATDYAALITTLDKAGVDFIVIGGVAANAHGSPRFTQDVDVVYARTDDNLDRVVRALRPLDPYPRGAPPGLPFDWSAKTLKRGLNFTLRTSAGSLDLLGEIVGGGRYEQLVAHATVMRIFARRVRVLDLDALIRSKRAAGRVKDFEAIAELELLQELANRSSPAPPPKRPT